MNISSCALGTQQGNLRQCQLRQGSPGMCQFPLFWTTQIELQSNPLTFNVREHPMGHPQTGEPRVKHRNQFAILPGYLDHGFLSGNRDGGHTLPLDDGAVWLRLLGRRIVACFKLHQPIGAELVVVLVLNSFASGQGSPNWHSCPSSKLELSIVYTVNVELVNPPPSSSPLRRSILRINGFRRRRWFAGEGSCRFHSAYASGNLTFLFKWAGIELI